MNNKNNAYSIHSRGKIEFTAFFEMFSSSLEDVKCSDEYDGRRLCNLYKTIIVLCLCVFRKHKTNLKQNKYTS